MRASARAAARARWPKSRTSFFRSFILGRTKDNQPKPLIFAPQSERPSDSLALRRKPCPDALARGDPWNDSGAPAVCDNRRDAGSGRASYSIVFRNHAADREPTFFLVNTSSPVPAAANAPNPLTTTFNQ